MKDNNYSNQIFDGNRRLRSEVFYDVFSFGDQFKYIGLSENFRQIQTEQGLITLETDGQLLFNGQVWSGEALHKTTDRKSVG